MPRHDMLSHLSKLDDRSLNQFCKKYGIGPEYNPTAPGSHHRVTDCPDGFIALYTNFFEQSNLRLPFSLFFLDFLKEYRVSISQLSPVCIMKLLHFEIVCRAFDGQPSLPLFRRFFVFARYGHWYTVRKHRVKKHYIVNKHNTPGYLSWIPPNGLQWKDSFFWVSSDSIPFKMHWRKHHEPLNIIHPKTEEYDRKLYRLLVKHRMRLQPFPEHVLVMTGLSRNWPYVNAEPVLKHRNQEMGLLKYIEMKGAGVKLTTRSLAEHEVNIVDRTRDVCYEGPLIGRHEVNIVDRAPDVCYEGPLIEQHEDDIADPARGVCYKGGPSHVAEIEGDVDVNTGGGGDDVVTQPRRLLFGSDTELDPLEKESQSRSGKRQQPEPDDEPDEANSGSCSKKMKPDELDHVVVISSATDSVNEMNETPKHTPKPNPVGCLEQLVGSVPDILKWHDKKAKAETRLRKKISQYRVKAMFEHAKNVKLTRKLKKLKDLKRMSVVKRREALQMVAENTVEHQKVVVALQKQVQDARAESEEKLKEAQEELEVKRGMLEKLNGELEMEKDAHAQERVPFERVVSERKWLIQEGFEYVINRLHRSQEYLEPLGAVQTNLWASGAHHGVVEGYASCKAGVSLEDVSLYKPEAHGDFLKAVDVLEHTRFPYVEALSRCGESTLDELKHLSPWGSRLEKMKLVVVVVVMMIRQCS